MPILYITGLTRLPLAKIAKTAHNSLPRQTDRQTDTHTHTHTRNHAHIEESMNSRARKSEREFLFGMLKSRKYERAALCIAELK